MIVHMNKGDSTRPSSVPTVLSTLFHRTLLCHKATSSSTNTIQDSVQAHEGSHETYSLLPLARNSFISLPLPPINTGSSLTTTSTSTHPASLKILSISSFVKPLCATVFFACAIAGSLACASPGGRKGGRKSVISNTPLPGLSRSTSRLAVRVGSGKWWKLRPTAAKSKL